MITKQQFETIYKLGYNNAMDSVELNECKGGLFVNSSYSIDKPSVKRSLIDRRYKQLYGELNKSMDPISTQTRVYSIGERTRHSPAIRAITGKMGDLDEAMRQMTPAGVHATPLGPLGRVLRNPDEVLPQSYIDHISGQPFENSNTVYDRLKEANDFEVELGDVSFTINGEEHEIKDFDVELDRDGETVIIRPQSFEFENTSEITFNN